jgi:AraC-like DNA-binding protein
LIETTFRSEDLSVADRFDHWRELLSGSPAPMDVTCDRTTEFRMYQRDLHVDPVRVWAMDFAPVVFHRTRKLIRRSDCDSYNVILLLRGTMESASNGSEAAYNPFDLQVIDSGRPLELRTYTSGETVSCVGVEVPKAFLQLPGAGIGGVVGRPISGRDGMGALLADFLTRVVRDTSTYRRTDGARLGTLAADLVSALFAHVSEADGRLTPESQRRALVLRIKAFIRRHLHDPDLNPGTIAAAHHISVSYLHRLFQADDVSVAALIRHQRLERACRDLADPGRRTVPIHQIAARWGFSHHAVFARAFRDAYGMSPRDYRHSRVPG